MKIKVTADSTCDLSQELVDAHNITIVPLSIVKDGKSYIDGIEIKPEDIYEFVTSTGKTCNTTAVNAAQYIDLFSSLRKEYDAIIHFTISSEMSACYQNAVLASQEVPGVYPIDSRNLSTGIGHLVLDAAIMAEKGLDAEEIVAIINDKKERLDVSFLIDTLTYLWKGGRCSGVTALGANLLGLKPCIEVTDGAMGVGKKYRGNIKKSLLQYVKDRLAGRDDIDTSRIFITDSGISDEIRQAVHEAVAACQPFEEIIHTRAGCTVSNHCGPNTLGILYYHK
jgi:DegV family protein with EDD domain